MGFGPVSGHALSQERDSGRRADMTGEERTLVQYRLERAREALDEAEQVKGWLEQAGEFVECASGLLAREN